MSFAAALGTVLVLWVGGWQVVHKQATPGELVAFLFYLALFYDPIRQLHGLNQILQAARAAGERMFDILDTPLERADNKRRQPMPTPVRGEVVYENVSFSYAEHKTVLRDISLQAQPGEMIALVGPTGAGKSTLVNLLPAFYELSSGRITIDGHNIGDVSLESLRRQISIVSQEAFLFNGTVRENILYGKQSASEAELFTAAQAANCHEFISRLPEGYDSRVGERGVKLSVGEKQRVSIARALLKDAPILILDEATASVDTGTERLIQEALARLMANRTSFVIAHRLSTIREADQIIVLRDGQIIERGTHDELVALNGLYARLSRIQNTRFIEESFEKLSVLE
jgi:ATP-binding cassette subfamily B protein